MKKVVIENPAELVNFVRAGIKRHPITVPSLSGKGVTLGSPRLSLKEQVFFAKRLSFLINAGVTLVEGLSMMREQARGRSQKKMLDQVLADVMAGQSLSRSFGKFPRVFNDFTVSIVKVGESSGTLATSLEYLAEELKKKQILRRKVVSAFIYPALITAATFSITAFLMLYLFPKIMPIFTSLRAELPITTKIVMGGSIFLQHYGLVFLLSIIVVVIAVSVALKRSKKLHLWFDHMLLKLPVVGSVILYYNVANTTRTLGLLLKSGVRLSEAIIITGETTRNLVYRQQFEALAAVVNRGERISNHLKRHRGAFPDMLSHMIAVGERSGTLSDTLVYLSDMYDHEVDEFTKNLSTLIEPALMIVMGVIVGFIAISIITPIYGITQNLHN